MRGREQYRTWIFDCDGVLLDTNEMKTQAFYHAAKDYGDEKAHALAKYHTDHGGVSRYVKIDYFFSDILKAPKDEAEANTMLRKFANYIEENVAKCEPTKGCQNFLESLPENSKAYVISGTDQNELRTILKHKNLDQYFCGIYGSPRNKIEIIEQLKADGNIQPPTIFVGDGKMDYEAASHHDLDFAFLSGFTDFPNWQNFFQKKNIPIIEDFSCWPST